MENPIVDCNYLADPLDMLVFSEACRFGNEVVMNGDWDEGYCVRGLGRRI